MNQELRNRVAETVVVSAVLVAAWFVLAEPGHARIGATSGRLAQLEEEAAQFESAQRLPPEQSRILEQRIARLLDVGAPLDALQHHEHILALAREHDLDVERINPGQSAEPLAVGPIRLGARRIHIEANGAFANVSAFLSGISCEAPMTVIEHFSVSARSREKADEVTLSAWIKVGGLTVDRTNVAEVKR